VAQSWSFRSSSSPFCLLINMHKKLFSIFLFFIVFSFMVWCGFGDAASGGSLAEPLSCLSRPWHPSPLPHRRRQCLLPLADLTLRILKTFVCIYSKLSMICHYCFYAFHWYDARWNWSLNFWTRGVCILYIVGINFYTLLEHISIYYWSSYLCTSTQLYTLLEHTSMDC
jgi:hypothetical protein